MSGILDDITQIYPSLGIKLTALPAEEATNTRLMGELALHIVDSFEVGRTGDVIPAFELVEHMLAAPNGQEHTAAFGFLETVQNVASHRKFGYSVFERYLGPRSQSAWTESIEVWRGKTGLAEVVASETGARLGPRWWQFWRKRDRRIPSELLSKVENPELRRIIEQITRE
jgi:hypothetical protein